MCGVRVEEKYAWPSCQTHYDLNTAYTDFYSWVWESLYGPHGPVHVWLGGVMDCKETYRKIASLLGKEISAELAYFSFVHRKNLFRSGMFKCETLAEVEETPGQVMHATRRTKRTKSELLYDTHERKKRPIWSGIVCPLYMHITFQTILIFPNRVVVDIIPVFDK